MKKWPTESEGTGRGAASSGRGSSKEGIACPATTGDLLVLLLVLVSLSQSCSLLDENQLGLLTDLLAHVERASQLKTPRDLKAMEERLEKRPAWTSPLGSGGLAQAESMMPREEYGVTCSRSHRQIQNVFFIFFILSQ